MTTSIDVVLATNRPSPYLTQAVASVLEQTYTHWHLIVVDDGSPDPEFLRRALPPGDHPVTFLRQAAGGVSRARNTGLRVCRGEWVTFLDDDDVWDVDRLSLLAEVLKANPGAAGAYSGGRYIDKIGEPWGTGWRGTPGTRVELLRGEVPLPRLPTLLFRRGAVAAAGNFDEAYRLGEDNDLILRVVQQGELVGLERALVSYRRHPGNTSVSGALEGRVSTQDIMRRQVAAASSDRREADARALAFNLRRLQAVWATDSFRGLKSAWAARAWGLGAAQVHWLRTHPRQAVASLFWLLGRSPLRRGRGQL